MHFIYYFKNDVKEYFVNLYNQIKNLMALNNNGFFLLKNRNFFFHSGKLDN